MHDGLKTSLTLQGGVVYRQKKSGTQHPLTLLSKKSLKWGGQFLKLVAALHLRRPHLSFCLACRYNKWPLVISTVTHGNSVLGSPLGLISATRGRSDLIFLFCLKAVRKIWRMIPLLGGYAGVNTVAGMGCENCRKKASSASEFKSETKCPRCKRYLQNESRRAYLQKVTSDFLLFVPGLGLSKKTS